MKSVNLRILSFKNCEGYCSDCVTSFSLYVISDECQFLVLIVFDIIFYKFYKDVTNVKDLETCRNPRVPVS